MSSPEDGVSLKGKLYQVYLDEFGKIFKPGVWCLDDYYLREGTLSMYPGLQPRYFESLDAIRKKALQEDRPFWATVRCKYHSAKGEEPYFMPEEYAQLMGTVMNIEARTALAYGAKGLMFWTIQADPKTDGDMTWAPLWFDFESNVGSEDDEKSALAETAAYKYLPPLLEDLKRFGHLFLSSTAVKIGHINHSAFGINSNTRIFKPIDKITTSGLFCMALHKVRGGEFVVMVNTDMKQSHRITLESSVSLNELTGRGVIDAYSGTVKPMEGSFAAVGAPEILGDKYTLQPDPKGGLKVATEVEPGDWRIFYYRYPEV